MVKEICKKTQVTMGILIKRCTFAKRCQDVKPQKMMFTERIKLLREQLQLPQRKLAEALGIDSATYCKIEKGERRVKREQIFIIAQILETNKEDLLSLWLADQVVAIVEVDEKLLNKVLEIVKKKIY